MTIEYIRYKIDPSQRTLFMHSYSLAAKQLKESPYCLSFELSECKEEKGKFILRIEWTSNSDHLQGFRNSELFQQFFDHVRPYFNNIQEMKHYTLQ